MKYSEFKEFILQTLLLSGEEKSNYLSRAIFYTPDIWEKIVDTIKIAEKNIITISKDKKYNKQFILLEKLKQINKQVEKEREEELLEIEENIDSSLKQV